MSEMTARFDLPMIAPGQAQKELYHNEALARIDGLLHPAVEGPPQASPPSAPSPGDCFLVGAGASGTWEGQDGTLALWTEGGWRFLPPQPGTMVWDKLSGHWRHWNGSEWRAALPAAAIEVGGVKVLGERQPPIPSPSGGAIIDAEARACLEAVLVALKSHGLTD